jgi:hypothetical protein
LPILDHSTLKLTNLVLWGLEFKETIRGPRTIHQFYSLMSPPTLRRLQLLIENPRDMLRVMMPNIVQLQQPLNHGVPWPILPLPPMPMHLEHFTFASTDSKTSELGHTFQLLDRFRMECPHINSVVCLGGFNFLPENTIPKMRYFRGPPAAGLTSLLAHSDTLVEHLDIDHRLCELTERGSDITVQLLERISDALPLLRDLSVNALTWDDELLHAIHVLFPKLHRLRITYSLSGPSEVCSFDRVCHRFHLT